jgi:DNA helicase II / ATP-dependent DNA helicase PcrA
VTPWLDDLDDDQRQAVLAPLGPVAVIAGPGSGKTRTVVARITDIGRDAVDPRRILALTHTTKAAGELRDRVAAAGVEGVWSATIHAVAWKQLRQLWRVLGLVAEPNLVDSTSPMVRRAAGDVWGRNIDQGRVLDTVSEIDWAAARLLTPATYATAAAAHGRKLDVPFDEIAAVWKKYIEHKQRDNVVDFGDVVALAAKLMAVDEVAERVRAKFGAVFLDEYQDVDPAQHRLITAWLGTNTALTVVGDPDQSVFAFKGADPAFLTDFAKTHSGAVVVHLVKNYRSTPEVVAWVNRLTLTKRPPLIGMQPSGPTPIVSRNGTEEDEERAMVDAIRNWHRTGTAYEAMAVLFRFNAAAARVEAALSAAHVPYQVAGSNKFFERPEIKAVLIRFGAMARAEPDSAGVALVTDAAQATGWAVDKAPEGMGAARQRWEAVTALVDTCTERYPDRSAGQLLAALQERAREAHDMTPGGVTVSTVHGAKGLEWECVWILGASEGQMPSVFATTRTQLNEEQHVMYVAVSRAKRQLVVSCAERRHNNWTNKPSRYLDLLTMRSASKPGSSGGRPQAKSSATVRRKQLNDPAVGAASSVAEALCQLCGDRLIGAAARLSRRCSGACLDSGLAVRYQQLVAWRAERAAQTGETPSSVATDKALFSITIRDTVVNVPGLSAGHAAFVPPK